MIIPRVDYKKYGTWRPRPANFHLLGSSSEMLKWQKGWACITPGGCAKEHVPESSHRSRRGGLQLLLVSAPASRALLCSICQVLITVHMLPAKITYCTVKKTHQILFQAPYEWLIRVTQQSPDSKQRLWLWGAKQNKAKNPGDALKLNKDTTDLLDNSTVELMQPDPWASYGNASPRRKGLAESWGGQHGQCG